MKSFIGKILFGFIVLCFPVSGFAVSSVFSPIPVVTQPPCGFVDGWNGFADKAMGDGGGLVFTDQFTTNGPQTINTIWVNAGSGANPYVFISVGIYSDVSGFPATLLVSAACTIMNIKYNAFPVVPIELNGTYWVAYQINSPYYEWSERVTGKRAGFFSAPWPYTGSLPVTASGFKDTSAAQVWDVFADDCVMPTNSPTPAFTPTHTPFPTNTPRPTVVSDADKEPFFKKGMILGFGDSTSEIPGEYLDELRPAIYRFYGNGGPGLRMFNTTNAADEKDAMTFSSKVRDFFNGTDWVPMPENDSIDGEGVGTKGAENDWLNYTILNKGVTTATQSALIYLQQPGGGSFVAGYAPVTNSSQYQPVTVNASGTAEVKAVTLVLNQDDPILVVNHINGDVCLFGFYAVNGSGASLSRVCNGGNSLARFAVLNPTAMTQWMKLLPHVTGCLMSLGINDRKLVNGATFYSMMEHLTSMITTPLPDVKTVLINPSQTIDYHSTHMPEYATELENLATVKGYGFFDDAGPNVLGNYIHATNQFWMLDLIHPNNIGAKQIDASLSSYLGLK